MIVSKWLNNSIWLIFGTITGTTTLSQSVPGSNGSEGVIVFISVPELKTHHRIQFNIQEYCSLPKAPYDGV